jgi:hypothetical protein
MISVHSVFVQYFDDPLFTKIKDVDNHSIYMCKLTVQLANAYRYLVAITPRDVYFKGKELPLSHIKWTVFQTRELNVKHPIRTHTYTPKQGHPYNFIIYRSKDDENYKCDSLPVTVNLLGDDYYPYVGKLNSALETYNTIVILL